MDQKHGYPFIVLASVIWGTMGIFAELAYGQGMDPASLTALRITVSSLTVLIPVLLIKRDLLRVNRKDLPSLLVLGVLAVALQRLAYFFTVELTTVTIAAVLFYTYPVFVTVYAVLFLKEKLRPTTILAVVLTFAGALLVVRAYEAAWLEANFWGLVAGLLCSVLFALYFLVVKRLRSDYSNWTLLVYGDGIGALALSPVLLYSFNKVTGYSSELWVLILVIALFPSLTAYLLFSHALKHVESSKGSILSVIEPLSAGFFSAIILGERFEPLQILGTVLALSGIVLLFLKLGGRSSKQVV